MRGKLVHLQTSFWMIEDLGKWINFCSFLRARQSTLASNLIKEEEYKSRLVICYILPILVFLMDVFFKGILMDDSVSKIDLNFEVVCYSF